MSCRGVFPKTELLRFVAEGNETAFDERQNRSGRGYYLCPARACFLGTRRNRRARTLFGDEKSAERAWSSVRDTLLLSLQGLLERAQAAGAGSDPAGEGVMNGGILLIRDTIEKRAGLSLSEEARGRGAEAILVPSALLQGADSLIITNRNPKISPILRKLRFYERLSSEGRVL